jgi:hypothetical protein
MFQRASSSGHVLHPLSHPSLTSSAKPFSSPAATHHPLQIFTRSELPAITHATASVASQLKISKWLSQIPKECPVRVQYLRKARHAKWRRVRPCPLFQPIFYLIFPSLPARKVEACVTIIYVHLPCHVRTTSPSLLSHLPDLCLQPLL